MHSSVQSTGVVVGLGVVGLGVVGLGVVGFGVVGFGVVGFGVVGFGVVGFGVVGFGVVGTGVVGTGVVGGAVVEVQFGHLQAIGQCSSIQSILHILSSAHSWHASGQSSSQKHLGTWQV